MSTRSMVGKFNENPPITSDPIQLSSDHESPHNNFKEGSTRNSNHAKETKFKSVMPSLPQEATITPSPQIHKPYIKCDMPYTSPDKPKTS